MAWIALVSAGLLEVLWAYLMKQSHGFTRPGISVATVAVMIASFGLLAYAMRTLPLSTSYMLWTGIGAIGAFLIGTTLLNEPASLPRILAALLIVAGIALMKLSSAH